MRFFVTCPKGTEGALRREMVALRVRAPKGDTGGVSFEGTFEEGLKVCLHSRVGVRVLLELSAFSAGDAQSLYTGVKAISWADFLDDKSTIAVTASVRDSETLHHTGFAALKVKDAVVDALRDRLGRRPDVAADDPDVSIVLHLRGTRAHLFLDLAGEPLHRRGYRKAMTAAPLKESLAAAVLALGPVPIEQAFVDPMTGSGTLAIEQALKSRRIAPGLHRPFGFERWPGQTHLAAWNRLKAAAQAAILPRGAAPIWASDIDPNAISAARANAQAAGVGNDIRFATCDFFSLRPPAEVGTLCVNPPYGERVGTRSAERGEEAMFAFYRDMGRSFATFSRWTLVILSGNLLLGRALVRKPAITHRLFNGPLEARLLRFDPVPARAA